jgi:hypothetical protein
MKTKTLLNGSIDQLIRQLSKPAWPHRVKEQIFFFFSVHHQILVGHRCHVRLKEQVLCLVREGCAVGRSLSRGHSCGLQVAE